MKIIDLLNKIANGEEVPKIIKWGVHIFTLWENNYIEYGESKKINSVYVNKDLDDYINIGLLNDEVEIIEEPKEHKIPEKLSYILHEDDIAEIPSNEMLMNKINEILDCLEKIK